MPPRKHLLSRCWLPLLMGVAALVAGCALRPASTTAQSIGESPWAYASTSAGSDPAPGAWEHLRLPGKTQVRFIPVRLDGRDALVATAESAASVVRRKLRIDPAVLGRMRFSWKVPELIANADMATRQADDSPVRVVLAFEGDRSRFSAKDSMLAELVRAVTGEEMPYATLMYVWGNQRAVGTVIHSARTDRIRKIVVESGPSGLGRWLEYERDVRVDFERAFGEAPGPLVGVAIMTDTDNTRTSATAWYGPVRLLPQPPTAAQP